MDINIIGLSADMDEYEDILRCLNNLYSTVEGSMPGDRDFGLSSDFVDQVTGEMESLMSLEIMEKTDRYEPRVRVNEVQYEHSPDGRCNVTVIVEKRVDAWQTS